MKKVVLITRVISFMVTLTIISFNELYSQVIKNPYGQVSIASPTAAAINKFTDIPVSYHTGIPTIEIPVYTVNEGPLSLPISLNYHAGGVKLQETASWVGLGWSLSAGGVITRSVQGAPDERNTSTTYGQDKGYFSDYGFVNYSNGACDGQLCSQPFYNGTKDGEPDLFFFNFNGVSGKFYFNDDRTPVFVNNDDYKLDYVYVEGQGSIQTFILYTKDGTKYYFGRTPSTTDIDPVETTDPFLGDAGFVTGTSISSWYLNKMVSADDAYTISLIYEQESYGVFNLNSYQIEGGDPGDKWGIKLSKNIINGVRLRQIKCSNGDIYFDAGATRQDLSSSFASITTDDGIHNAKVLEAIRIVTTSTCKKIKFQYSYFEDNVTSLSSRLAYVSVTTDRKRLKLEQIQEMECSETVVLPPTIFNYNSELLPRRLSCAMDHWGFINDATNNQGLIPTYTLNKFTVIEGANRESSWPAMRAGTLNQITYPTGGSTNLLMEPNNTWVSYTDFNPNLILSASAGYDGNPNTQNFNINTAQSVIKIRVSNTSIGGNAYVYTTFGTMLVEPGQVKEQVFAVTPGNIQIGLSKNNAQTGQGCSMTVFEMLPIQVQQNKIVGGLRIKKITVTEPVTNNTLITDYTYTDGSGKSTGILYSKPTFARIFRNEILGKTGLGGLAGSYPNNIETPLGCTGFPLPWYVSGNSTRIMDNSQGNHIGYNEVKVAKPQNGFSIYRFWGSNYWETFTGDVAYRNLDLNQGCNVNIPNYPDVPLPFEYKRGLIKYEGIFNESGNLIQSTDYDYDFVENELVTPCVKHGPAGSTWLISLYSLKTSRKSRETITKKYLDGNGNMLANTRTIHYESAQHHQPTRIVSSNSKNQVEQKNIKYSLDFKVVCDFNLLNKETEYSNLYNTATSQFEFSLVGDNSSFSRRIKLQDYFGNIFNARRNYITYKRQNLTDANSIWNTCYNNYKNNTAGQSLKSVLELRSKNIVAPIEETTTLGGAYTSAVYTQFGDGLNSSRLKPNNYFVLPNNNLNNFAPAFISNNDIVKDANYSLEANYIFKEPNLVQTKMKSGTYESYLYDAKKINPIAKIINAKSNEVFHYNFEDVSTTDWDWNLTAYDNTKSKTGSFSGRIDNPNSWEKYTHSNTWLQVSNTGVKKYRYSVWLYSTASSAEIYFFMKTATETGYFTNVTSKFTAVQNKWVLLEGEFDVQSNITQLSIRLDNNGGGTVWFDDVRLYPAAAQMATYTYEPLVGMTSQTDANQKSLYYLYDAFNRLSLIKDKDDNVIKRICYNYKGLPEVCYTPPVAPPPPPPATIYARVSYENYWWGWPTAQADVVVRFYTDAAGTIPANVTNIQLNYTITDCNGNISSYGGPLANGNMIVLEYGAIVSDVFYEWWTDEWISCNYNYALASSTAYTIIY